VKALRVKSNVKAGFRGCCDWGEPNHNQTPAVPVKALPIKSNVKAGGLSVNNNQTALRKG
jgi:hypothetical protein